MLTLTLFVFFLELSLKRCFEDVRLNLSQSSVDSLVYFPSLETIGPSFKRARALSRPPSAYAMLPEVGNFPVIFQQAFGSRDAIPNDTQIPSFLYLDIEYQSPNDPQTVMRILGFMTFDYAIKLTNESNIYVDGTFKICPAPFRR